MGMDLYTTAQGPEGAYPPIQYYSKKHIDAAFAKYEVDSDLTE